MAIEKPLCCKLDKGTVVYVYHRDKQECCKAKVQGYIVDGYDRFDDLYFRTIIKQVKDKSEWAVASVYFRPEDAILQENEIKPSGDKLNRDEWLQFVKSLVPKKESFFQNAYFNSYGSLKTDIWYIDRDNKIEKTERFIYFYPFVGSIKNVENFGVHLLLNTDLKAKSFTMKHPQNVPTFIYYATEAEARKALLKRVKVC